jgi:hypothetical protein
LLQKFTVTEWLAHPVTEIEIAFEKQIFMREYFIKSVIPRALDVSSFSSPSLSSEKILYVFLVTSLI